MDADLDAHARLLHDSHLRWTGKPLVPDSCLDHPAPWLDQAAFALVSHGIEADPVFNYANACALRLFGTTLAQFTRLPSRLSAAPDSQVQRERLMALVTREGHVEGYSGIRIGADGRRFRILDVTIWNLVDANGTYRGQAALIPRWCDVD
jgi:hypothetical protein